MLVTRVKRKYVRRLYRRSQAMHYYAGPVLWFGRRFRVTSAPVHGSAYDPTARCRVTRDGLCKKAISASRGPGKRRLSPSVLSVSIGLKQCAVFSAIQLDTHYRVMKYNALFQGMIDGVVVHRSRAVRLILAHKAADFLLTIDHSSGLPEPNQPATARLTVSLSHPHTDGAGWEFFSCQQLTAGISTNETLVDTTP